MPLNELVKEYSIQTVSEKTKISIISLERLKNREWGEMKEPQVIGFIRIIEKKYGLDLSDLEADARAYYKEHKSKDNHNPIDIVGATEVKSESKLVSGFVTLLSLAVVAYATWYYLQEHDTKSGQGIESNVSKPGMFEETLKGVKSLLGMQVAAPKGAISDGNETNSSLAVEENRSKVTQANNEQNLTIAKEEAKSVVTEGAQEHKKFDITAVANEENSSGTTREEKSSESLSSTTSSESSTVTEIESNTSVVEESNGSSQMSSESNATVNEITVAGTEINNSQEQTALQESNISDSNASESNESLQEDSGTSQSVATISEITIKPLSKRLWLGIYNLDTHKRVNKFITSKMKFPVDGNYAIITGHSRLEISGETLETMRFPKKGRVYLLVSPKEVREIGKNEYKRLTKSRAW